MSSDALSSDVIAFDIDVEKRLGDRVIATRFTAQHGLTALSAPSGAGKTSILNMVAGLLRPDSGHVRVAGRTVFDSKAGINLPPERRRVGYVFQDGRLFPHKRVRDNLLYGWRLAAPADRWMDMEEAAGFLDIAHLLDRWPHTLSGGESQRVAIGRAILAAPAFLLMDEPLSSIDPARREEIIPVIERVRDRLKLPILYVTHDKAEAQRLAGKIVEI